MSIMPLANSLMLDFRSLILPRFVYATGNAFNGDQIIDPKISQRVLDLARAAAKLDRQLKAA
jgi:FMN reductase